jgi:hypothetical protein
MKLGGGDWGGEVREKLKLEISRIERINGDGGEFDLVVAKLHFHFLILRYTSFGKISFEAHPLVLGISTQFFLH